MRERSRHSLQDSLLGDFYCAAISVASLCPALWVTGQRDPHADKCTYYLQRNTLEAQFHKDPAPMFLCSDNSFCREGEKRAEKCLLPGLPAPPCASMQPRRERPAVQHTGITDNRGGEKGRGQGRERGCLAPCAQEREQGGTRTHRQTSPLQ